MIASAKCQVTVGRQFTCPVGGRRAAIPSTLTAFSPRRATSAPSRNSPLALNAYTLETALNGASTFRSSEDVASQLAADAVAGKRVFVTGATSGIGKETAKQLVQMGATVLLTGRTVEQAQSLAEELGATALPAELNLASLESVAAFKKACKEELANVDVVVANAGVGMVPNRAKTDDGHEIHFGVNHLGHFALLQDMVASLDRLVVVASETHRGVPFGFDLEKLEELPDDQFSMMAYGHSKLGNLLYAHQLRKRLAEQGSDCRVYSLCPGFVTTGLPRYMPRSPEMEEKLKAMHSHDTNPMLKTLSEGAATSVYLTAAPEEELQEAGDALYWTNCRPMEVSETAIDDAVAEDLWALSEELVAAVKSNVSH